MRSYNVTFSNLLLLHKNIPVTYPFIYLFNGSKVFYCMMCNLLDLPYLVRFTD